MILNVESVDHLFLILKNLATPSNKYILCWEGRAGKCGTMELQGFRISLAVASPGFVGGGGRLSHLKAIKRPSPPPTPPPKGPGATAPDANEV